MKKFTFWIGILAVTVSSTSLHGANVALLDSANTRLFFGLRYPDCSSPGSVTLGAREFERYFLGWKHLLDSAQPPIPFDLLFDSDVTRSGLAPYKLLILSNTVSLSDDQVEAIIQWVKRGGRLLATFGSGYKDISADLREADQLKVHKGGRGGLSQLWHDPLTKLFSSASIDPGVDILITESSGPTAGLPVGTVLPYGAAANMLVQRPENYPGALGYLVFDPGTWTRPQPALLHTTPAKGVVVYYSFAPEQIISLEFDLAGHCPDDTNYQGGQNFWAGRSTQLRVLMEATINYLLSD